MSIFWEHHHKSPLMRTETICSCPLNIFSNVYLWLTYIAPGFCFQRPQGAYIIYIVVWITWEEEWVPQGISIFVVLESMLIFWKYLAHLFLPCWLLGWRVNLKFSLVYSLGKWFFPLWYKIGHNSLDKVFPKYSEFMLACWDMKV